jgi:TATA-box binding protein (TBP) (component of TFIID and TFIIIB)
MSNVKISTITLSTEFPNCTLNLINIGKYLTIDDTILGIKYNYANFNVIKGTYATTIYKKSKSKSDNKINRTLFYNQISLVVNNDGYHVNVKLFKNGSLHMTGCKSINDGEKVAKMIYKYLNGIRDKQDTILLTKDENGVLMDKDKLVYTYKTKQIIGHMDENNMYIINKKQYVIDSKTEMFINSKIENKRTRSILNFDGDTIGYSQIQLVNNRNKYYKKNTNLEQGDDHNDIIYYNNETIIGKIVYNVDQMAITKHDSVEDIIEATYSCNPFGDISYTINDDYVYNINVNGINVYFNMNFVINRQRLYESLSNKMYMCKYKPETYSGVKLTYKTPLSFYNHKGDFGICNCNNQCTCLNITFLIFLVINILLVVSLLIDYLITIE